MEGDGDFIFFSNTKLETEALACIPLDENVRTVVYPY